MFPGPGLSRLQLNGLLDISVAHANQFFLETRKPPARLQSGTWRLFGYGSPSSATNVAERRQESQPLIV